MGVHISPPAHAYAKFYEREQKVSCEVSFSFNCTYVLMISGMMDIALLTANANQLRFLITYNSEERTFIISATLLILSLIVQVAVGIGLIFKVCKRKEFRIISQRRNTSISASNEKERKKCWESWQIGQFSDVWNVLFGGLKCFNRTLYGNPLKLISSLIRTYRQTHSSLYIHFRNERSNNHFHFGIMLIYK